MAEDTKSPFQGFGLNFDPFSFTRGGAGFPAMSELLGMQQKMATTAMEFGQRMAAMAKSDLELGADVMRRLVLAKTPEELAAWQRDMLEFVSSKYFEQWIALGEQVHSAFAKVVTPAQAQELELVDATEGEGSGKGSPKPKLVA